MLTARPRTEPDYTQGETCDAPAFVPDPEGEQARWRRTCVSPPPNAR